MGLLNQIAAKHVRVHRKSHRDDQNRAGYIQQSRDGAEPRPWSGACPGRPQFIKLWLWLPRIQTHGAARR